MEKGCILPHNLLQQIQKEGNVVLMSLARFCNCTEAEILDVLSKRNQENDIKSDTFSTEFGNKNLKYGYTNYMKKNGRKQREISIPCKELKKIQEVIKQRLSYIPVSLVATAGKPGDSAQQNAELHRYNKYLITMDIKNAYPSIDTNRVYKNLLGSLYKPLDTRCPFLETKENKELFIRAITHLCVNNNTLPQGASTSSQIQNIVMRTVDTNIEKKLPELTCSHMIYSRYADDMTISFASFSTMKVLQEKMTGYQTRIEQSKKTDMTDKRYIDDIIENFAQDVFVVTDSFEIDYLGDKIEEIKNTIQDHPKLPNDKKYDYIGTVNHYKQQVKYSGWRIDQVVVELLNIVGKQGRKINLRKLHTRTPQTMGQREINGMTFDYTGRRGLSAQKKAQFVRLLNDLHKLSLEEIRQHGHYKVKFKISPNQSDKELIATIKNTLQGAQNYLSQIYNEKGNKQNNIPTNIQETFSLLQDKWSDYEKWDVQNKERQRKYKTYQKALEHYMVYGGTRPKLFWLADTEDQQQSETQQQGDDYQQDRDQNMQDDNEDIPF